MARADKPLVWLRGEIKTPPLTAVARLEAGTLLRRLHGGEKLGMRRLKLYDQVTRED